MPTKRKPRSRLRSKKPKSMPRKNNHQTMTTPIIARNLTRQARHSPRERVAGFAIAKRAVDKCCASLAGTLGEYHYDCPMDNMLFTFKGINGEQFKAAVQNSKTYED